MKTNVLIFPAGEINSVELHDSLSHDMNINVFGASSIDRHGPFIFKRYRGNLPIISDDSFISEFNKLISEWKIDYIFPTHDTVALFLANNQKIVNAKVITAAPNTASICRDKKQTYKIFSDCDFCPKLYDSFEEFPVFIKQRKGQGSKDSYLIRNSSEIPTNISLDDFVILEYLPGEELTVDCLTDNDGNLCVCTSRTRDRIMAGVCVAGKTVATTDDILSIAKTINDRLRFFGLWYFQIKKDTNEKFKLLEISARCAGTMCLTRAKGINLPLLSVYVAMGKNIDIFENQYNIEIDRSLISRYKIDYEFNTVYIAYEDTVIENHDVCLPVIRFLYQCKNKGVKVVLLTRFKDSFDDSIDQSLEKHAISKSLFNEIVKLSFKQNKSDYIRDEKSIFIDNEYMERKIVHDNCGIPVFGVENIETLVDWKL